MANPDNFKRHIDIKHEDSDETPDTAPEFEAAPDDSEESKPAETEAEPMADPETDKAVDDIMKKDGDEALKVQDEAGAKSVVMKQGPWERFKNFNARWWGNPRKRYGTIGGVVAVLVVLGAVPFTRYNVAGLVMKSNATISVVDSKSGAPVTGATVELAGQKAETDAKSKAVLHVSAGSKNLQVSKKYYQSYAHGELVALSGNSFKVSLLALGHQVKVKVVNKVTGKPVSGAVLNVQGGNTKTDSDGLATVVIASGAESQDANVSLTGYNSAKVSISASGDLAKNTFSITPSGKLYFLSNLSGKIDVVKTNLDGTDRQTVLAGTGNEDRNSTSLLASRDWKYLALLSKRSGDSKATASVYLIDTTNGDKLTTIDEGDADFSLVGWSGDRFIYQVSRNSVSDWQPNKYALKSFDPTTGHTLLLDQTQASGTNQNDWLQQNFGTEYLINNQIIYTKGWNSAFNIWPQLNAKQAELDTIGADGTGHQVIKTFAVGSGTQTSYVGVASKLYEPAGLYIDWTLGDGGDSLYKYEDGKVVADSALTSDQYNEATYSTYLLSPSGNSNFWSDPRDGKNTLFTGDQNGGGQKQVASLSDYNAYGWYTDNYLLVSKNSSELYIMPASGGTPFKITDYYKPAINYNGYGGGYGGQ